MKPIITNSQKIEIEKLANEHSDALIAYGGELHRQGIIKGSLATCAGILIGASVAAVCGFIKTMRS